MDAELRVDVLHVGLHGVAGHDERLLDVGAVAAAGEHGEHLGLARGKGELLAAQREAKACSGVRAAGIGTGTDPVPAPGTACAPASVPFPVVVAPTSTGSMPSMAPAKVKRFSPMVT